MNQWVDRWVGGWVGGWETYPGSSEVLHRPMESSGEAIREEETVIPFP